MNSDEIADSGVVDAPLPHLLNSKQVRAYLQISESTLRRWCHDGILKPCGPGKRLLFKKDEIASLISSSERDYDELMEGVIRRDDLQEAATATAH